MATLSGEAADMSESVVDDWSRQLESVYKGDQVTSKGTFSTRTKQVSSTELCLPSQYQSKLRNVKV